MITTTDPRTGVTVETQIPATSDTEVDTLVRAAVRAAPMLADAGREQRAAGLDAVAGELERRSDALVATAVSETGLSAGRLAAELARSAFQFRMFGTAIREGSYLEAVVDHAAQTPLGPGPELRRMLIPIGPVAVFGSSNFPFAFSVAGGDTASALAAGSPVVLKAHSSHPLTSRACFAAIAAALDAAGLPAGSVGIVFGQAAGGRLVAHPGIKAVGFTGSLSGARALQRIIDERPEPIPFYGELSSINPLVVTRKAAAARAEQIAAGLVASVTGSGGQLCTKPGVVLIPDGDAGDRLTAKIRDGIRSSTVHVLLNRRIFGSYSDIRDGLIAHGARETARGTDAAGEAGFSGTPTVLEAPAAAFTGELAEECFGPLAVVVRYHDAADIRRVAGLLPGSLTATIHAEDDETAKLAELSTLFAGKAGRLVYNGYPTGVRVSWAQHHGGPWPATNTLHTSVGVTALRRFLRPFAWQNAPQAVLPPELRDDAPHTVPIRVDGRLMLPAS